MSNDKRAVGSLQRIACNFTESWGGWAFAAMALLKGFDTKFPLGVDSRSPDPYPKHSALELSTQVSVLVLGHVHAGKSPDVFGLWFPHG